MGRPKSDAGDGAQISTDAIEAPTDTLDAPDERPVDMGPERTPYPKNPACAQPALGVTRTVLTESFETHAVGGFPGPPWVEANVGRTAQVSDSWVHGGQRAFVVQSFLSPGQPEIIYAPLAVARTPARLTLTLFLAPNGFIMYRQFASVGFGEFRSRFELDRHLTAQVTDHTLSFQGSAGGAFEPVWNELVFASSAFRDSPPAMYNYLRGEFDFCAGEVRWYVGTDGQAPLRATLGFDAAVPINSFWIVGGVNDTSIDDLAVEAFGVLD